MDHRRGRGIRGHRTLAEFARHEGLFDWLAAYAVLHARGSAARLFALIYLVGTLVTVFLSNDATAVVIAPLTTLILTASHSHAQMAVLTSHRTSRPRY